MCEKCTELDKAIRRYRRVIMTIIDPATVDQAAALLQQANSQKAELHTNWNPAPVMRPTS